MRGGRPVGVRTKPMTGCRMSRDVRSGGGHGGGPVTRVSAHRRPKVPAITGQLPVGARERRGGVSRPGSRHSKPKITARETKAGAILVATGFQISSVQHMPLTCAPAFVFRIP